MRVLIEIDCRNSAFDHLEDELARILSLCSAKIARQLERDPGCVCEAPEADDKLLDSNGNTVGTIRVEREGEDHGNGEIPVADDEEVRGGFPPGLDPGPPAGAGPSPGGVAGDLGSDGEDPSRGGDRHERGGASPEHLFADLAVAPVRQEPSEIGIGDEVLVVRDRFASGMAGEVESLHDYQGVRHAHVCGKGWSRLVRVADLDLVARNGRPLDDMPKSIRDAAMLVAAHAQRRIIVAPGGGKMLRVDDMMVASDAIILRCSEPEEA